MSSTPDHTEAVILQCAWCCWPVIDAAYVVTCCATSPEFGRASMKVVPPLRRGIDRPALWNAFIADSLIAVNKNIDIFIKNEKIVKTNIFSNYAYCH